MNIENKVKGHGTLSVKDFQSLEFNKLKDEKRDIKKLKTSILKDGWVFPVYKWGDYVLDGTGRKKAFDELLTEGHTFEAIPYVEIHAENLEDAKKKALKASSSFGEVTKESFTSFVDGIEDLSFDDFEIKGVGMDDLIEPDEKDDIVPEVEEGEPTAKLGDIYQLGNHTLMCGDSTNEEHVKKLLEGVQGKTHCISDPPYGIAYDPKNDNYGMIENDDVFLDYIDLADKYTDGYFVMWTGYQVVDEWIKRIKNTYENITNMIIWHKGGGGMGDCARNLTQDFEIALVVNNGNFRQGKRIGAMWSDQEEKKEWVKTASKEKLQNLLLGMENTSVWKVAKDNTATYMHPTQKPVEINIKMLTNFTQPGENVLDLFLGSGGNLVACEKTNRKCYGMELNPKYIDVIIKRWEDYTGQTAIKIN